MEFLTLIEIARRLGRDGNATRYHVELFGESLPYQLQDEQNPYESEAVEVFSMTEQSYKTAVGSITTAKGEPQWKYPDIIQILTEQQERLDDPDSWRYEYGTGIPADISFSKEIQAESREKMIDGIREKVLEIIREKGRLESEIEGMGLSELRQLHQMLFEEAVRTGKERLKDNFDLNGLKKKVDNAFEHIQENMCPNPVQFCNRKNCDYYDKDCVNRKIRNQINRIIWEILNPAGKTAQISIEEHRHNLRTMNRLGGK